MQMETLVSRVKRFLRRVSVFTSCLSVSASQFLGVDSSPSRHDLLVTF